MLIFMKFVIECYFLHYFYISPDGKSIIVKQFRSRTLQYDISIIKKFCGVESDEYTDIQHIAYFGFSGIGKACGCNDDCLFMLAYNKETADFFAQHDIPFIEH